MSSLTATSACAVACLFEEQGVFHWAARARRCGASTPTRQVWTLGAFLAACTASPALALSVEARHDDAIDASLRDLVQAASGRPILSLDAHVGVNLPTGAGVPAGNVPSGHMPAGPTPACTPPAPAWRPREALAELMLVDSGTALLAHVRARLATSGLRLDTLELHDLLAMFASRELHLAIGSFDPALGDGKEAAWLTTTFHRFALRHALTRRRVERSFDAAFEGPGDRSSEPPVILDERLHEQMLRVLPAVLDRLRPEHQRALRLYFGMEGPEQSLGEVAEALSTNVYFARLTLLQALAALAARMDEPGLLDADERQVADLLFAQGFDVATAAQRLQQAPSRVQHVAARIGQKFRGALRARTRTAPGHRR